MLRQRQAKGSSAIVSIPFSVCPAKTYLRPDGETVPGRTVVEHCQIVGEVARALIGRYPQGLQRLLFPADAPLAAACHDIGKVSPYFFEKIRRACAERWHNLPSLNVNPELERLWGGHAGVSQVAAKALGAPAQFDFETAIIEVDIRKNYGETRYVGVGYIGQRLHVVVFAETETGLRIISLRKANQREIKAYAAR